MAAGVGAKKMRKLERKWRREEVLREGKKKAEDGVKVGDGKVEVGMEVEMEV